MSTRNRCCLLFIRPQGDDDLRADAVSFVLYRAALSFLNEGPEEKAASLVSQIDSKMRRAMVSLALAQRLTSEPTNVKSNQQILDRERALSILENIDRDLARESSPGAARLALGRVAVLAKLNPERALVELGKVVDLIDKIQGYDLLSPAAPNLGLSGFSVSAATVAAPGLRFDFRTAVDPLVLSDFEQVVSSAERFQSKELKGIARLEVARLYLMRTNSQAPKNEVSSRHQVAPAK